MLTMKRATRRVEPRRSAPQSPGLPLTTIDVRTGGILQGVWISFSLLRVNNLGTRGLSGVSRVFGAETEPGSPSPGE